MSGIEWRVVYVRKFFWDK